MFIVPTENMTPKKRGFEKENSARFRMPYAVNKMNNRLTIIIGNAAYLQIFAQILKKFILSTMALTSGLSYCLRVKMGALTTISFFFFFGTLLTNELSGIS